MLSLNLAWAIVWFNRETIKVLDGQIVADYVANFGGRAYQLGGWPGFSTVLKLGCPSLPFFGRLGFLTLVS
jgi:hypothetical protein